MLRKLMKYEFMAMGRIFLPLFGALFIISIINRILGQFGLTVPSGISLAISIILMVGIFVLVFVLTIQRFWNNLLTSEGYLMMTLPVSTDRLILSKLLVASVWSIVSLIVVGISILIMTMTEIDSFQFSLIIDNLRNTPYSAFEMTVLMLQVALFLILGLFSGILLLYACMSLSMLANRHRPLLSFGAFIAITTVLQIIIAILAVISMSIDAFSGLGIFLNALSHFAAAQLVIGIAIVSAAILCAIFYAITRYMLKNRLNLQ